jgi:hypothetical protein
MWSLSLITKLEDDKGQNISSVVEIGGTAQNFMLDYMLGKLLEITTNKPKRLS